MEYTQHALNQMARRGITSADVESALRRTTGAPEPGLAGSIWIVGVAANGRLLRVCQWTGAV